MLTEIFKYENGIEGLTPLPSLADRVYYHVVHGIIYHKYRLGDRITESLVAQELDISTVPVRDALVRLHQDGWIQRFPFKGAVISDLFDREVLGNLYTTRQIIEVGAAYRAAKWADRSEVQVLEQRLNQFSDYSDIDDLKRIEREVYFHLQLVTMGACARLVTIYEPVLLQCYVVREKFLEGHENKDMVAIHRPIYEAVVNSQPEEAARLTSEHLESCFQVMMADRV